MLSRNYYHYFSANLKPGVIMGKELFQDLNFATFLNVLKQVLTPLSCASAWSYSAICNLLFLHLLSGDSNSTTCIILVK